MTMKQNLLLLHGALGSKKQFLRLKIELEEVYNVYDLNFEGHGGRASNSEFSIELFTSNVIEFLHIESLEKVKIFGYSMGGYVALNTALKIPEKISQITTLGTKFNWDMESAERETMMLDPIKIEEKVPHFAAKLKEDHYPLDWKSVMEKTATMMLNMAKGAKLTDDNFKKIIHPVTIGIGDMDNMVSYEESKLVSNLLPNAKLIKLKGVKHPIDKIDVKELTNYIIEN